MTLKKRKRGMKKKNKQRKRERATKEEEGPKKHQEKSGEDECEERVLLEPSRETQDREGGGDQDQHPVEDVRASKGKAPTATVSRNELSTTMSSSGGHVTSRKRRLRRRRREELRSKSTGMGVPVDLKQNGGMNGSEKKNKRIVFDYDEDREDDERKLHGDQVEGDDDDDDDDNDDQHPEKTANGLSDSDDDDDVVEEMKSSVARELDLEERHRERATALEAAALSGPSKKRKRKKHRTRSTAGIKSDNSRREEEKKMIRKASDKNEIASGAATDPGDFDDRFFEELDEEMKEDRQRRERLRQKEEQAKNAAAVGQHTTFVFGNDDEAEPMVVSADHGVQVAVLREGPSGTVTCQLPETGTGVSQAALRYSRKLLPDGSDGPVSARQMRKAKKAGRGGTAAADGTWTRSAKMNRRLLVPGGLRRQRRYAGGRGAAAAIFCTKGGSER